MASLFLLCAHPLAAQAKGGNASATGTTQNGRQAEAAKPVNESELPILDQGQAAPKGQGGAAGTAGTRAVSSSVSTWDFLRMLLILACVVGAIYLLFWIIRKGTKNKVQENNLIRILGSRSLSGSRALHLVEVGRSIYLVGSSDGGVELISEITDKESLDSVRLNAAESTPATRRSFQQILSEIFHPAKRDFTMNDGAGFLRNQRDRLKKL